MQQDSSIPVSPPEATDEKVVVSSNRPPSVWRSIFSTIAIFVAAPLVALFLIAFVFQSYEVDGPSMQTTLQNHDRLIVWKMPRTVATLTGNPYIPHRGDIVIFVERGLALPNSDKPRQLIKRVIGLPGDTVTVSNGQYIVYNKEHPDGFNPDINHPYTANIGIPTVYDKSTLVGKDEVFVSGDNRTNSLDSRKLGTVPVKDIVGKLSIRIFPVSEFKSFIGQ